MKKMIYLTGVALAMLMSSCSGYDDGPVRDRIDGLNDRIQKLEELAVSLNGGILSVREFFHAAENNGDAIKKYTALEDGSGYRIEFAEAGTITVFNGKDAEDGDWKDGADGTAPVVGVAKDGNDRWYWTVDGEGIVDEDGNFIYLTKNADAGEDGKIPQLRVKDGMWQVSYNGNLWIDLEQTGAVTPAGGMYWFTDVEESDEYVTFTLRSSDKVTIPKLLSLNLTVSGYEDIEIVGGMTAEVDYHVEGMTSRTKVYAVSNCPLEATVLPGEGGAGKIRFKAPSDVVDGSVLVYADNGYGSTSMRMFVFKAGRPDVVDMEGYDPMEDFDWGIE